MNDNRLQLNRAKTEFIIFGSNQQLSQLPQGLDIAVGDSHVTPSTSVRNLGVTFENELNMDKHITNVCRQSMAVIRQIGKIRKFITNPITETLVSQLVTSRLDYCNSLLFGVPASQLDRLQRIHNLCSRIVLKLPRRESVTSALHQLHWLPISRRIIYKQATLVFKARNSGPKYLSDLILPYNPLRTLRSGDSHLCVVPRTRLTIIGDRAFAKSGPTCWNQLPDRQRQAPSISSFKKGLKTFLFSTSYPDM